MKDFLNKLKFTYSLNNIKHMYAQYPRMTLACLTGDAVLAIIAIALAGWGLTVLFSV